MREIEQKYRVTDRAALEQRLLALKLTLDAGHPEADHYLSAPDRDFVKTGEVFRMRRIGEDNFLTYKGPKASSGAFRDRLELEVPLPSGSALAEQHLELLGHLGYRPVAVVCKFRRQVSFTRDGLEVTVCLDEVDEVGLYCEVEVLVEAEQAAQAQAVITSVVADLGLTELERTSYIGLLFQGRKK